MYVITCLCCININSSTSFRLVFTSTMVNENMVRLRVSFPSGINVSDKDIFLAISMYYLYAEENPLCQIPYRIEGYVEQNILGPIDDKCPICLTRILADNMVKLPCNHVFCIVCILRWQHAKKIKTCPLCRACHSKLIKHQYYDEHCLLPCPNKFKHCKCYVKLKDMNKHLNECKCHKCGYSYHKHMDPETMASSVIGVPLYDFFDDEDLSVYDYVIQMHCEYGGARSVHNCTKYLKAHNKWMRGVIMRVANLFVLPNNFHQRFWGYALTGAQKWLLDQHVAAICANEHIQMPYFDMDLFYTAVRALIDGPCGQSSMTMPNTHQRTRAHLLTVYMHLFDTYKNGQIHMAMFNINPINCVICGYCRSCDLCKFWIQWSPYLLERGFKHCQPIVRAKYVGNVECYEGF